MLFPDASALEQILCEIGYHPIFRYEKFRTEYAKAQNSGKIMLDETPIGNFIEIEGSPRWIDRTAKVLGFSTADYITRSYGYLYLAFCRERRIAPETCFSPPKNCARSPRTTSMAEDITLRCVRTKPACACAMPKPIRWAWSTTPIT